MAKCIRCSNKILDETFVRYEGYCKPCFNNISMMKQEKTRIAANDMLIKNVHTTLDWHEFQEGVAALFNRTPGWRAKIDYAVSGARIGSVNIDVLATFQNPSLTATPFSESSGGFSRIKDKKNFSGSFSFSVVVECKNWNRPVPQEKVFALKLIVEDIGASLGLLVTRSGIQSGAKAYLKNPINIIAVTTYELESILSGRAFGVCSICGTIVFLPFSSTLGRPCYCRDCYHTINNY